MKVHIWHTKIARSVVFSIAVLLAVTVVQTVGSSQASAMFNRGEYHGFFTNSYATSGDYVDPGGIYVNNVNDFINFYRNKLKGSQQEKVMASFTIRTMLRQKVGSPSERFSVPNNMFDEWADLVRSYADAGLISFSANYQFNKNTFYQVGAADVAWYYHNDKQPSIVFRHPQTNAVIYAIKRSCANPVGELQGLVMPTWELEPSSKVSVNPSGPWKQKVTVSKGTKVYFRHSVKNVSTVPTGEFSTRRFTGSGVKNLTPNDYTSQSPLGAGKTRYIGSSQDGTGKEFNTANVARQYCESQAVKPSKGPNGTQEVKADPACVEVLDTTTGTPSFEFSGDCRDGITIVNLHHVYPEEHKDKNVAIRVRVYPHAKDPGLIVDQQGRVQSDPNFVFRTKGTFTIPWPSGYGAIKWRVDARAYEYGHAGDNSRSVVIAGYIVDPATDPSCATWELTPHSSVNTPFIEQGGGVINWSHTVTNHDPFGQGKVADGVGRCVVYNYDVYNTQAGAGGEWCGSSSSTPIYPGGPWEQDNYWPTIETGTNTPLGATYCQRYHLSKESEHSNNGRDSANACTTIVGGRTSLGVTSDKGSVEPTETAVFNVTLNTSQYAGHPNYGGYTAHCSYYLTADYTVDNQPGSAITGQLPCSQQITSTGPRAVNYSYTPTTADIGKEICLVATMSIHNTFFIDGSTSTHRCLKVITRPYMKVQAGDIVAGNGFMGGSCINNSAAIVGWNKNNPGGFFGAGATLAVFAQNRIQGFASGQGVTNIQGFGYAPSNLSFANVDVNHGAGQYGGYFGSGSCIPDYFGNKPSTAKSSWPGINMANNDPSEDQVYSVRAVAPLDLSGGTLRTGANMKLYVEGDVFINGNIVTDAAGGPVVSVADIPNFTLIAKGDIYIAPSVTQLYGTFVAQPNGGSGGNIYTCAPNGSAAYGVSSPATWYANCQNQLMVTGSLVAKRVHFLRVKGSLYQDNGGNVAGTSGYNNAAEIIRYNPLAGLRQSATYDTSSSQMADAYTTLPPIL